MPRHGPRTPTSTAQVRPCPLGTGHPGGMEEGKQEEEWHRGLDAIRMPVLCPLSIAWDLHSVLNFFSILSKKNL